LTIYFFNDKILSQKNDYNMHILICVCHNIKRLFEDSKVAITPEMVLKEMQGYRPAE